MGQALEGAEVVHRMKPGRKPKVAAIEAPVIVADSISDAQLLATRIWQGQSPDVPVIERVQRIVNALTDRGFGLNITLPHPDAGRYLNAH